MGSEDLGEIKKHLKFDTSHKRIYFHKLSFSCPRLRNGMSREKRGPSQGRSEPAILQVVRHKDVIS